MRKLTIDEVKARVQETFIAKLKERLQFPEIVFDSTLYTPGIYRLVRNNEISELDILIDGQQILQTKPNSTFTTGPKKAPITARFTIRNSIIYIHNCGEFVPAIDDHGNTYVVRY